MHMILMKEGGHCTENFKTLLYWAKTSITIPALISMKSFESNLCCTTWVHFIQICSNSLQQPTTGFALHLQMIIQDTILYLKWPKCIFSFFCCFKIMFCSISCIKKLSIKTSTVFSGSICWKFGWSTALWQHVCRWCWGKEAEQYSWIWRNSTQISFLKMITNQQDNNSQEDTEI